MSDDHATVQAPDLDLVKELVAPAAGTGLNVTLSLKRTRDGLPSELVQTATFRSQRASTRIALVSPMHFGARGYVGGGERYPLNSRSGCSRQTSEFTSSPATAGADRGRTGAEYVEARQRQAGRNLCQ